MSLGIYMLGGVSSWSEGMWCRRLMKKSVQGECGGAGWLAWFGGRWFQGSCRWCYYNGQHCFSWRTFGLSEAGGDFDESMKF